MIILCPDCSKPYELPDNQISALVQIACPQCAHAVILDFEAANDPSLQEAGHLVTSGFLSRQDYEQSLGDGAQTPAANRAPVAPAKAPAAAETKRPQLTSPGLRAEPKASKPTPVSVAKPAPAPAGVAPKPKTPQPVAAPPAPVGRNTTPPPAHPAPPAPPGTRSGKHRPRPPAPAPQPLQAQAAEEQAPAAASPAEQPSQTSSAFPQLGPGFGQAAPELPPMPSAGAGDRPQTVTIDLNQAALGENIYNAAPATPGAPPSTAPQSPTPASSDQNELMGVPPSQQAREQAQENDQAMQATISDSELEPIKKGVGWFWWVLALLLLAGGGFWGLTMMQQSEHAESNPTLGAP